MKIFTYSKRTTMIFLSTFFVFTIIGQTNDFIGGVVRDDKNQPIIGTTVIAYKDKECKNRIATALSDRNGQYKLLIPDSLEIVYIRYTYIGMKTKKFIIERKSK